jgi:hypothetical protein
LTHTNKSTKAELSHFILAILTMARNMRFIGGLLLLLTLICVSPANAYQLEGYKWPQPTTTFYVDIPGGGGLWNDSFETAMYYWGVDTIFEYRIVRGEYADPCDSIDGRNGVGFEFTHCGDAWGDTTLAIATTWFIGSTLTQTDIAFNSNKSWNVYSTSWSSSPCDFQRVAVHELGHALGLGHEDSGVKTIMGTHAGNITIPQQDDINGVAAIYGFGAVAAPATITVPASDPDGNYTVNWATSATAGVTYFLSEATNSAFTAGLRTAYSGSGTSTLITGRTSGVTYYYRVKATKSGYTDSAWVTGSNGCLVLGLATAATTNAASSISTTGATLNGTINANSASTTVTFQYGTTTSYGNTATATPGTVTGNVNTLVSKAITGLSPNTTYHYCVTAVSSAGTTNGSDMTFTTGSVVPAAGSFSNITQTCIRANWTVNGNPSGTQYYCENVTAGTNSGWVTSTSWDSCSLTCGTSYTFRVKARNGDGIDTGWTSLGPQSTQVCPDTTPPAPPAGLRIISSSSSQIDLTWNPNAEPDLGGYRVYYGTASRVYVSSINVGNVTTYSLTGLPSGQTYYIALTALDMLNNESEYSLEVHSGLISENPLNDTTEFVKQQYRDFLNREAETAGLQFWVNMIDSGAITRAQVIESFFWSKEFGARIAPIVRLYFAYFLRIPEYEGLMFWIDAYNSGWSLGAISDSFAGSEEFQQRYGALNNEAFVNLVYQNILGRAPDPGGYAFWVGELNSGRRTRGQVMIGFSESAEYEGLTSHEVFVTMMYVVMLRRSPEEGGSDFWMNYLDSGNSGLGLIDGFLHSQEYANRFQ